MTGLLDRLFPFLARRRAARAVSPVHGTAEAAESGPHPSPGERVYAVGPLLGRADLLDAAVARVEAHLAAGPAAERGPDGRVALVFLGDAVGRGSASRQVVAGLRALGAHPHLRPVWLAGGQERRLLAFLSGEDAGHSWLRLGGISVARSYRVETFGPAAQGAVAARLRNALLDALGDDLEMLRALPRTWRAGDVVLATLAECGTGQGGAGQGGAGQACDDWVVRPAGDDDRPGVGDGRVLPVVGACHPTAAPEILCLAPGRAPAMLTLAADAAQPATVPEEGRLGC